MVIQLSMKVQVQATFVVHYLLVFGLLKGEDQLHSMLLLRDKIEKKRQGQLGVFGRGIKTWYVCHTLTRQLLPFHEENNAAFLQIVSSWSEMQVMIFP